MALVYTYKINGARVVSQAGLTDVVKELDVTVTGTDGAAKFDLPTQVKLEDADPNSFTAFDSLTEEQMIAWIAESPQLDGIKGHIAYVVAKEVEKLSMESKPLPWAPAPTEPAAPAPVR
jgi:hypothetical protein